MGTGDVTGTENRINCPPKNIFETEWKMFLVPVQTVLQGFLALTVTKPDSVLIEICLYFKLYAWVISENIFYLPKFGFIFVITPLPPK